MRLRHAGLLLLSAALATAILVEDPRMVRLARGAAIDPASFVRSVDNPWFPLKRGSTYVYLGVEKGKQYRAVVKVTTGTKTILGVSCVVVQDDVYVGGRSAERTADWYAQDREGNVWYFGEATAELDTKGRIVTTEGSWEAGVDGAEPGIVMPAHPKVGRSFRQEYYKGHAEDHFRIISLSARVQTPYASANRALKTREWTPLETGSVEFKYYVRGVGLVKDADAELVEARGL
jgi:hypothetical protein